jgi:hypothetical protein
MYQGSKSVLDYFSKVSVVCKFLIKLTPKDYVTDSTFPQNIITEEAAGAHVDKDIFEANRALIAMEILRQHVNKEEQIQLVTSNYFSLLWYNSEVWNMSKVSANTIKTLFFCHRSRIKSVL